MALTLRLPRWDPQAADRLARAGVGVTDAPKGYVGHGVEVHVEVTEGDPVTTVSNALRGWTVILDRDFVAGA